MLVAVLSRAGQSVAHALSGLSLAQGSMLLRLRRASLGLLFAVSAVGFGLVLFIAQLGWPGAFRAPIPGAPQARVGSVHDAVALAGPGPSGSTVRANVGGNARHPVRGLKGPGPHPAGRSHLGGSHELSGVTGESPGVDQPTSHSPAQPAGEPASPAPVPAPTAPVTAAVETAPQPVTPAPSSSKSKAGETAAAKIASDGSGKPPSTSSKSQGKSMKDKSPAPVAAKPSQQPAAKIHKDESTAAKAPPAQPAAPASTPAASKEAADAAGDD